MNGRKGERERARKAAEKKTATQKRNDVIAHSTGTGCEWENVFYAFKFRKTIIQLHAVFRMQNQIETLNLCVYFVVESIENAAHVLAIMGTNSLLCSLTDC